MGSAKRMGGHQSRIFSGVLDGGVCGGGLERIFSWPALGVKGAA